MKKTIAAGATTLPARQTLDHNEAVETKVQECAEDLDSATKTPAQGIDQLKVVEAERHAWTVAVMFLDLDRFKNVNDAHGHAAGDVVLKEVAKRLAQNARDEDTVCRNGGDEFLYLLMNPQGQENAERIAAAAMYRAKKIECGYAVCDPHVGRQADVGWK